MYQCVAHISMKAFIVTDKSILNAYLKALGATVLISALYLSMNGLEDAPIRFMLRTSAQTSFAFLILILITRPLFQLHKKSYSKWLMKNRTFIGVSFAGIHTGHLLLIFLRAHEIPTFNLVLSENKLGALAYLMIFLMLVTSFKSPKQLIGARLWKRLHKFGLYFITFVFVVTVSPDSVENITALNPWLAGVLLIVFGLRTMAFFKSR